MHDVGDHSLLITSSSFEIKYSCLQGHFKAFDVMLLDLSISILNCFHHISTVEFVHFLDLFLLVDARAVIWPLIQLRAPFQAL